MARILKFTIEGLAGRLEPFSAVLNGDVNVFFGLNGSGKTTLLKILHSALSLETDILKDAPFRHAEVEVYLNRYQAAFVRRFTQSGQTESISSGPPDQLGSALGASDDSQTNELAYLRSIVSPQTDRKASLAWVTDPPEPEGARTGYGQGFLPISRLYRNISTTTGTRRLSDQELDSAFARGLQVQWTEYYADISKSITKAQEKGLANILEFFLSGGGRRKREKDEALDAEKAYKSIRAFLSRQPGFSHLLRSKTEFVAIYQKRRDLQNVIKQIELVEKQIDAISAPRERFRRVLESMFTGSKHLVFTEKDIQVELPENKQIGLSLLSSGEKQLLFIALNALVGGDHSLIIDEPELSMHVDWQKKLVATLRDLNPNIQQIMATHSPEIMADLPDDRIFRL